MELESCPKCGEKLILLKYINRHICRTCEALELSKNKEPILLKDSEITCSKRNVAESEVIPVEIEVLGSHFNKSIGWSAAGATVGTLVAGPLGAIIGIATQGNGQKFHYIIKFSDGTQKVVVCDGKNLQLDLTIWLWRINEKKTEEDYVTFGLDFSSLERSMVIPKSFIDNKLCLEKKGNNGFYKKAQGYQFNRKIKNFFKSEIERYFKEQKNDVVTLLETTEGLKIPSKALCIYYGVCVLAVLFFIFGGCAKIITSGDSNRTNYIDKEQIRKESRKKAIEYCKVVASDPWNCNESNF